MARLRRSDGQLGPLLGVLLAWSPKARPTHEEVEVEEEMMIRHELGLKNDSSPAFFSVCGCLGEWGFI